MKPVTQVRTGFGRGQCTEAAIASLLELDLDVVPDLWAGPDAGPTADEQQPMANRVRLWEWLKSEHGVMQCGVKLALPSPFSHDAHFRACRTLEGIVSQPWARYHLFSGDNPDGVSHYVVGHCGRVVWDPNPLRRGLVTYEHVEWLIPLAFIPDDARHLPSAEWDEVAP